MTTLVAPAASAPVSNGSTHPFTCNTCQVAFKSSEGQRNHMHTDWHRYNLKRRITELPPISSEVFAEKVLSSQADARRERDRASFEKSCEACGRTYYSQNAYNNHINSYKHKQREAIYRKAGTESVMSASAFSMDDMEDGVEIDSEMAAENDKLASEELSAIVRNLKVSEPSEVSSQQTSTPKGDEAEEKEQSLPITECLFCGENASSLQQNIEHMSKTHGLFIPEQQYLVNLEGLIRYLGQKVLIGNTCLYCNKQKGGLDGIRTHMRDKGHCMIAFETEDEMVEIGEYYDFRSTYDDEEEDGWEDEEGNEAKPHDENWETDSDASSVDSAEIGSLRAEPKQLIHRRSSSHHLEDGWHSHAHSHAHHAVYFTETEMHLPSGRSVGHRSLARYYRQNLRDRSESSDEGVQLAIEDGSAEEDIQDNNARISKQLVSRANGGAGLALASAGARSHAAKMEKKDRFQEHRGRERYRAKIERQANNQKHYRDPNMP